MGMVISPFQQTAMVELSRHQRSGADRQTEPGRRTAIPYG